MQVLSSKRLFIIVFVNFFIGVQPVDAQKLDMIIDSELNNEINRELRFKSFPIYQANEEVVNGIPLKEVVHGQCGLHVNTCMKGHVTDVREMNGTRWSCQGSGGGRTDFCYVPESAEAKRNRRLSDLAKDIDKEVSNKMEDERLKLLEEHGRKTMERLNKRQKDADRERVAAINNKILTTTRTASPRINKVDDQIMAFYIGGGAGVRFFSGNEDVDNGLNVNATLGAAFSQNKNWLFETGFSYSDFKLSNFYYYGGRGDKPIQCIDCRIKEYAATVNVKRHIFTETIRPFVGFSGVYRYRDYQEDNILRGGFDSRDGYYNASDSHGFDMGINAGVDFALNSQFMVGAEFKYMINLVSAYKKPFYPVTPRDRMFNDHRADDMNYFTFGVNAKFFL